MKIKKIKDTYNDYQVEMSFGQLTAIRNALGENHSDPLSDELYAELNWYLDNIPGPGESEDDLKKEEEAAASGMGSAEAGQGQPVQAQADQMLPAPPEEEMPGEGEPGGEELPPEGGEEGLPPEGGEELPPEEPGAEGSEMDRRLPPPPAE